MEQTLATLAVRVDKLERDEEALLAKVNAAVVAQATVSEKLCAMMSTLDEVRLAVGALEHTPVQRFESFIRSLVTALVSAAVGYLFARFG